MVRVISQNFSPPRSRHSSGETDRDLAERANLALSTLGRKRSEIPDYESSSDSFWDSEFDGDHNDTHVSETGDSKDDINGNENPEKSDVQSKRKERRRERNKLSAQAYRQRIRRQNVKEQQTLHQLESENKRLHRLVETLEKKREQAKQYLRGCPVPMPDILHPIGELEGACAEPPDDHAEWSSPSPNINNNNIPPPPAHHNTASHSFFQESTMRKSPTEAHTVHHPSGVNDKHVPLMMKGSVTPDQANSTTTPVPPRQFVINGNTVIDATFPPSKETTLQGFPVPTFVAVPIENQKQTFANANLNCNPLRTCPPANAEASTGASNGNIALNTAPNASPFINAVFWNVNGNQITVNGNAPKQPVFMVNMETCNNNTMSSPNLNANDKNLNGNINSCDRNVNTQINPNANSQLMSFNLNLNQTTGAAGQGNHNHQDHHQSSVKNPPTVQYFLAPNDQGMSVSVQ